MDSKLDVIFVFQMMHPAQRQCLRG